MKRDSIDSEESGHVTKKEKIESSSSGQLNLDDLGAGYLKDDKRVERAIGIYEKELLPFIRENSGIFGKSNFLDIRGYGTNIKHMD